MGSANGTRLDKHSLNQSMSIPPGGVIRIGSSEITLVAALAHAPAPTPTVAAPPAPPPSQPAAVGLSSMVEELQKLAQLRQQGILTDAEFQEQKRLLLQAPVASAPEAAASAIDLPRVDERGVIIEESGPHRFVVEAGVFSRVNVQEAMRRVAPLRLPVFRRFINMQNTIFYLLHIGPYATEEEAQRAADLLSDHRELLQDLPGYGQCRVAEVQDLTRAEGRFDKRRPIQAGWPGIA
ncbi:MAG: SHOCT domain-containing protein [Magnetococcales bacterium]|nr:SHOCT domain-containing protein [Magnetococcales bacterium]